ncbi:MAG: heat-shock protein [Mariprofundus sp.]|nr:heat-shock protein [Mariprofundus sp.]
MNTLLLAITALALVILVALVLRPMPEEKEPVAEEDERISPLLRGINYLLSDEPDRALQEMVQVARLRSEAADVYMALGEMFRSRGEIGRAVRIHQNLLARPDLPQSIHLQAHVALAIDFQTGGLLDRALMQYQKALDIQSDHAVALEATLRIREQSSEWLLAEELLSRLERVRDESYGSHRAYLFSEVARQHFELGDFEAAGSDAARALELDAACAPARMVEIDLAMQQQNSVSAVAGVRSLWQQAREHFPLAIPSILKNDEFYQTSGLNLLRDLWLESHDAELMLAWIESLAQTCSNIEAQQLCDELGFSPHSLRQSLRLNAILGVDSDVHTGFARQWRKTAKNYACEQCGVEVVEVRWQCPQCHSWGTLHPKTEESV